jgi:hypothetical protein
MLLVDSLIASTSIQSRQRRRALTAPQLISDLLRSMRFIDRSFAFKLE